jgi:hypothetical protein
MIDVETVWTSLTVKCHLPEAACRSRCFLSGLTIHAYRHSQASAEFRIATGTHCSSWQR